MGGHRPAVLAVAVHGRGDRGRRVDDEQVTRGQEMRQVTEPGVGQAVRRGDEHPHAITSQAAFFRWLAGGDPHDATAGTARSAAR